VWFQDNKEETVQKTAKTIAESAYQLSFDSEYMSPFSLAAMEAGIALRGMQSPFILTIFPHV
jgi:hypothetical protein